MEVKRLSGRGRIYWQSFDSSTKVRPYFILCSIFKKYQQQVNIIGNKMNIIIFTSTLVSKHQSPPQQGTTTHGPNHLLIHAPVRFLNNPPVFPFIRSVVTMSLRMTSHVNSRGPQDSTWESLLAQTWRATATICHLHMRCHQSSVPSVLSRRESIKCTKLHSVTGH